MNAQTILNPAREYRIALMLIQEHPTNSRYLGKIAAFWKCILEGSNNDD